MTDYASSGVDLQAGSRTVELMAEAVRSTYGPEVLAGLGSFGGVYDASALKSLKGPLLVASTDGVGTKVMLAARFDRFESLGADLVNHCVNDILVQGARPLFFLDYLASSRLEPDKLARVVTGMAGACREAGCALLGGETAEMPGVYCEGQMDVVGTVVGLVDRSERLPRTGLASGDVLVGLASSGPHTNGYSLIRKLFPDPDAELVEALLQPHRSYLRTLGARLGRVKALAHITGGGLLENLPRVLPMGLRARVIRSRWKVPPLFERIASQGVAEQEMFRVFNMGIGMVAVLSESEVESFCEGLGVESFVLGQLETGERGVVLA
ncbi:phosphoribosylformylglycinamidine cyclo-ligase [bacterium CPR1]|nr:phosphoribosylformylglycinamidine cyclo-ligase [bacterium CPR1]